MKNILLIAWQLPQLIVFWLLLCYYELIYSIDFVESIKGVKYYYTKGMPSGMSLNGHVILNSRYNYNYSGNLIKFGPTKIKNTIKHEEGHSKQSIKWGWLYLPLFGIPSLIHNIVYRLLGKRWDYYSFYTERNANKLVNLKRKNRQWV